MDKKSLLSGKIGAAISKENEISTAYVLLLCVVVNSRKENMEAICFRKEKDTLNILSGLFVIFGPLYDVVIIWI